MEGLRADEDEDLVAGGMIVRVDIAQVDLVSLRATEVEDPVPCGAGDAVVPSVEIEPIPVRAAVEVVLADIAADHVIAAAAVEDVAQAIADQRVVAIAAKHVLTARIISWPSR